MTQVRITRLEKMLQVLWDCGRAGGCSRLEIAQALGLKKTPYLTGLLNQLVVDGWTVAEVDTSSWPHRIRYQPSQKLLDWHAEKDVA